MLEVRCVQRDVNISEESKQIYPQTEIPPRSDTTSNPLDQTDEMVYFLCDSMMVYVLSSM